MPHLGPVHQWDVFRADLEYVVGREQGGESRPVIVVSNDGFNEQFSVVTVVPLTKTEGKQRKVYPFEIVIPAGLAGNPKESIIMPYQIRTIDKKRLVEWIGSLTTAQVRTEIEDRIIEHIGVNLHEDAEE